MNSLRPSSQAMQKAQAARFKPIKLFSVAEVFGSEAEATHAHFGAGGWFEKLRAAQAASPAPAAGADQFDDKVPRSVMGASGA